MNTTTYDAPTQHQLEAFLYHEAELLDAQQWAAWDALFTDDGVYWLPAAFNQPDAVNHISHIHENRLLRAVRIARFTNPEAYSLQPPPRSSHLVSNVMLRAWDASSGALTVSSRLLMLYYRRDQQTVFGGKVSHDLLWDGAMFKIRQKRVDLVNCDAMHESVQLYI